MNTRRSLGFLVAVLALVIPACSQVSAPATDTTTHLGPQAFGTPASESANGLAKYSSGVYVVGSTSGNLHGTQKGKGDAFIRKVNTRGEVIWGRQFGTSANDAALDVATDAGGNAYVFGRTSGNLARTVRGDFDFFVRKYTPSGSVAWTRQMGLDTSDVPGGVAVSGNSVYMVGTSGYIGVFLYRFNLDGGTVSKNKFSSYASDSDVTVDGSGNIYAVGTVPASCDHPDFQDDCSNVLIRKYNASGNSVWSKHLNYAQDDSALAITAHGSDVYVLKNRFDVPDDESYTELVKLDVTGTVKWVKFLGVFYSNDDLSSTYTAVSADGSGVYAATTTHYFRPDDPDYSYDDNDNPSDAYRVSKFRADGSADWDVGLPADAIDRTVNAILARGNGDLYIAGAANLGGNRGYDAFVKRLDAATGSTVWK